MYPLPDEVMIVAYADDIHLIVVAKSIEVQQHLGDTVLDDEFILAAKKTEAVLIPRKKKRVYASFTVNDQKIRTRDTMKYLGVTIDERMSYITAEYLL